MESHRYTRLCIARNFRRTLFFEVSETSGIFQKFSYKMAL